MTPVHDRMPVILPRSAWQEWLDPANHDTTALQRLLVPAADDLLTMHPVSTAVNNVRNKGEELIEPAERAEPADDPDAPEQGSML
jgi:putative SOS response-associated peptidase YedK